MISTIINKPSPTMLDHMPHPLSQIEIVHQLTEVGFTQRQAETQAKIITEVHEHTLATKEDVKKLEVRIDRLETKMENGFSLIHKEFSLVRKDIELLKSEIVSKITVIMGTLLGLFALIQKFF